MLYEQKFLLALFLTLIIEVPIVFVLTKYVYKYKEINTLTIVFVSILASSLTLPYLWFVLPAFIFNRITYLVLSEFLVFLVEGIIYFKVLRLKLFNALVISLVANIASIILGLLVNIK